MKTKPATLAIIGDNFTAQSLLATLGTESNYLYEDVHVFSLNQKTSPWVNGQVFKLNETTFRFYDYSYGSDNVDALDLSFDYDNTFLNYNERFDHTTTLKEFVDYYKAEVEQSIGASQTLMKAFKKTMKHSLTSIKDRLDIIKPSCIINTTRVDDINPFVNANHSLKELIKSHNSTGDTKEIMFSLESVIETFDNYDLFHGEGYGELTTIGDLATAIADSTGDEDITTIVSSLLEWTVSFNGYTELTGKMKILSEATSHISDTHNNLLTACTLEESYLNLHKFFIEEYTNKSDSTYIALTSKSISYDIEERYLTNETVIEKRLFESFKEYKKAIIIQTSRLIGLTGTESYYSSESEVDILAELKKSKPELHKVYEFGKLINEKFKGIDNTCMLRRTVNKTVESIKNYDVLVSQPDPYSTTTFQCASSNIPYYYCSSIDLAIFIIAVSNEFRTHNTKTQNTVVYAPDKKSSIIKGLDSLDSTDILITSHAHVMRFMNGLSTNDMIFSQTSFLRKVKDHFMLEKKIKPHIESVIKKYDMSEGRYEFILDLSKRMRISMAGFLYEQNEHYNPVMPIVQHGYTYRAKFSNSLTPERDLTNPISDYNMIYSRYKKIKGQMKPEMAINSLNFTHFKDYSTFPDIKGLNINVLSEDEIYDSIIHTALKG